MGKAIPAYIRGDDGVWIRVGSAKKLALNQYDVTIDADLETCQKALKSVLQGNLARVALGEEPPEPHDDEYPKTDRRTWPI
jgi:hypothetical protein